MALLWNQCFFLKKFSLAEIDIIYEGMFRSILNFTSQMQMSSQMSSWRRSYGRNGHGIFCRRWGWRVHVDSPKLLYRGPWRQKHHPNMTTLLSVTAQTKQQYIRRVACTSQTNRHSLHVNPFAYFNFWRADMVDVWNSLKAPLKRCRHVAQVKIRESQVFQNILLFTNLTLITRNPKWANQVWTHLQGKA